MRSVAIEGGFGLNHLVVEERERPSPGPGQVLLDRRAMSLNYRDLLTIRRDVIGARMSARGTI